MAADRARVLVTPATVLGGACLGGESATPSLRVETHEMKFSPKRLQGRANEPFAVIVENEGDVAHTFSLNELGLEVKVNPGEQRRLEVNAAAAEYEYVCRILDHEGLGMVGQLVIT